jgi:hypothetical protein
MEEAKLGGRLLGQSGGGLKFSRFNDALRVCFRFCFHIFHLCRVCLGSSGLEQMRKAARFHKHARYSIINTYVTAQQII